MVKNSQGKAGYRSFTVVSVGKHGGCKTKFHGGKYVSKTPVQAARKAFSELCRIKKIRGVCTLTVSVKETTQGSSKKVYTYKLNRHRLKKPMIMKPKGSNSEYVIEYDVVAKSIKTPTYENKACKLSHKTRGRMKKRTARKTRKSVNNVRRLLGF